jgi:hypothetical protein
MFMTSCVNDALKSDRRLISRRTSSVAGSLDLYGHRIEPTEMKQTLKMKRTLPVPIKYQDSGCLDGPLG